MPQHALHRLRLAVFGVLLALGALSLPAAAFDDHAGGMLDWPQEEMVAALDDFIERRMDELSVPGVAIAIVSDGEIIFEKGYGIADATGDQQVTANTLFEVSGIGLPLQAYAAMTMAAEGKLPLDAPLSRVLQSHWVPNRQASEAITLRHVLTHRSGLSNWVRFGSRSVAFEAGTDYRYSGMGYVYLAHAMAVADTKPFDRLMRERLFQPLGMSSSGYVIPEALVGEVARGHDALWVPILALAGPMVVIFILLIAATMLFVRFVLQRLKLKPLDVVPAAVAAPLLSSLLIYYQQGGWSLLFSIGYFAVWVAVVLAVTAALQYARFIVGLGWQDGVVARGRRREPFSPFSFTVVVAFSLFFMSWQVPLPARDGDDFNAALSLRSSAHDLGLFVAGFINGDLIGANTRARMVAERVEVSTGQGEVLGAGLGFLTRERADGLTIWQPSDHVGLRGLLVIEPARRSGVVVLSNSDSGRTLVHEVAGHILGVETRWQVP